LVEMRRNFVEKEDRGLITPLFMKSASCCTAA